jgi:uncharacterized protein YndB with AHSA1/START domain
MNEYIVEGQREINARPDQIFDLLADPGRHSEIDGSGTVKKAGNQAPQRLALGSKFEMSMKLGAPYKMINEVVEYEENRRIAWQPRWPGAIGKIVGGRIWRYILEPVGENKTLVTESWDITQDPLKSLLARPPVKKRVAQAIKNTLDNLEKRFN